MQFNGAWPKETPVHRSAAALPLRTTAPRYVVFFPVLFNLQLRHQLAPICPCLSSSRSLSTGFRSRNIADVISSQSTLTYSCICSNGTAPDVSAYQETLPFYICEATYVQCIAANPNDAQGQDTCRKNQKCGTLNATAVEGSSGGSSASSSTSATARATSASAASGSSAAAATGGTRSNAVVAVSHQLATTVFAAVFLAVFKLLL